MAEQKNTRLERRQLNGIEEMVADGKADNQSEAHRMALDTGLSRLGYDNGHRQRTWLQWFTAELAKVMLFLTVGWMGATMFFPVEFQYVTLYLIGATFAVVGADQVLGSIEPEASAWMTGLFGRQTASQTQPQQGD